MKSTVRLSCLVVVVAIALASCATTVIEPAYQVDFRNMSVPVMLSQPAKPPVGRTVPISYTFSTSSSTSSYSSGNVTVTTTTTRTSESAIPIAYQLLMNMNPNDGGVVLRDVMLNYHIMMMPYYGENSRLIKGEAVITSKRSPQ
jgi:hypothetical protein